ncbi:3-(L-alanin-3-ylcarbamoyl)-2-[(2-aminoethylcarbamoyl)methyl]-2-hydroxypropanoate synthase SbnF [Staphylococcus aureus]
MIVVQTLFIHIYQIQFVITRRYRIVNQTILNRVKTRVMHQLVSSLIYENIVVYKASYQDGVGHFTIEGHDSEYRFTAEKTHSFDRIRITSPIERVVGDEADTTTDYTQLLREAVFTFPKNDEKLEQFIVELLQTELKDTQSMQYRESNPPATPETFNDYEFYAMEGHQYHPSYKSRLGFTLSDNLKFGPDFVPNIKLQWLAIDKGKVETTVSRNVVVNEMLRQQVGDKTYEHFVQKIEASGKHVNDVEMIPVHPWQFEHVIQVDLAEERLNGTVLWLGESDELYHPQQSIRTMSPIDTTKYYLKVPISITNTSTKRVLAPHTIENAAQITDWLKQIQQQDTYLKDELKTVFLGEVLGQSYLNTQLSPYKQTQVYGALGVIWRENIYHMLIDEEDAIPFNALYASDKDGVPFIEKWIKQYGSEAWTKQFLAVAIRPMIHMLYYHGIAFESHAQNMMLIHENGWPTRIALKDFHDGVRFKREHLSEAASHLTLKPMPEAHKKVNSNSFIETDDERLVRDFLHDAFFFINIAEIILFIEKQYGIDEQRQWQWVKGIIEAYQEAFPELNNYQHFDLFEPTIQVEKLTTRRLLSDSELRIHHVTNPLGVGGITDATTISET